eukprot:SAG22_NODE_2402_length_2615_cov_3.309618_4_plen_55_part_00
MREAGVSVWQAERERERERRGEREDTGKNDQHARYRGGAHGQRAAAHSVQRAAD